MQQPPNNRKSRVEGKPSLLPKPRRPGSTDRLSTEARRPSTGLRSSSADPPRTHGLGRPSREASATKLPLNKRSKSQQNDQRSGQSAVTPLRSSHYPRATTTPVRTPSGDRSTRSWERCLDRALGCVTVKDQRQLSNPAWQRAEFARVQHALAARGEAGGAGGAAGGAGAGGAAGGPGGAGGGLIRPLTIARFVDICAGLLTPLHGTIKLNNDNYVVKLPLVAKRLLYPGAVSKSWLKTVNTLHAFPHALALIGYLLDLVERVEAPVNPERLYLDNDDHSCLRRDYLHKCWIRFQYREVDFEDLKAEYFANLRNILGDNDEKILELKELNESYALSVEAAEAEAQGVRAEAERREARRRALQERLRAERGARAQLAAERARLRERRERAAAADLQLDRDIERARAEAQQLQAELGAQSMSVAERTRLLEEADYMTRVHDSKQALTDHVAKMVTSKEYELAQWQKKTLDSCMAYNQGLIRSAAALPELSALRIDEKELMSAECGERAAQAAAALRGIAARLAEQCAERARARHHRTSARALVLEKSRQAIAEKKALLEKERQLVAARAAAAAEAAAAEAEQDAALRASIDELRARRQWHDAVQADLDFWEDQDAKWRSKLSQLREAVPKQRAEAERRLAVEKEKRERLLSEALAQCHKKLDELEAL